MLSFSSHTENCLSQNAFMVLSEKVFAIKYQKQNH
jgi:hypothetical protein